MKWVSQQPDPTKWGLGFEADSGTLRGAPKLQRYVVEQWPTKLQKDKPGLWVKKDDYELYADDPECVDPPESEPIDPYKPYFGVAGWRWEPTIKGMTPKVTESTIQRALNALVPTGNPFLDLCIWKGGFPSTKARFCTQYLKIIPIAKQVYFPLFDEGYHVVS
ncbi:hypothetical protein [Paenibacillus sp. OAS669]|uniref:hypothetical protein n=1 Tax=Paenibacillus sp. OAS669 TaxID=2663821 RepID=UPI001A0393A6|nr:hypothetical protein [Paenibacillus sp. OAS669]MBE1446815.1 hypothetical protein [Paenibacillus sp. OAS669]